MAHAECAVAHTAADTDQLYIGVGVCTVNFRLLIASCRKKARRRCRKCFLAAFCKTGRNADQILLRDTHLHKLLRIRICKRCQGSTSPGIAAEHYDIFIRLGMFH